MKHFGNCIWLTTNPTKYIDYTNGFQLHMSIKTNLDIKQVHRDFLSFQNQKYVLLLGDWIYETNDGFYCYYRKVKKITPELKHVINPHVSFYYSYEPIKNFKFKNIDKVEFDSFVIKNCNGHFLNW